MFIYVHVCVQCLDNSYNVNDCKNSDKQINLSVFTPPPPQDENCVSKDFINFCISRKQLDLCLFYVHFG